MNNKYIKRFIRFIANPYSPILTLIVGWLLTILATAIPPSWEGTGITGFVQLLIAQKAVTEVVLLCWFFGAVIYSSTEEQLKEKDLELKNKDNEIFALNESIKEKKIN